MPTLLNVSLDELSQSADPANLAVARVLMAQWNEIIGAPTDDESELMQDPAGFVVYAYAIVIHALRTESNPNTPHSLRASRSDLLSRLPS